MPFPLPHTSSVEFPPASVRLAHAIASGGFYGAERVVCDLMGEQATQPGVEACLLAILDPWQESNALAERVAAGGGKVIPLHLPAGLSLAGLRAYANVLRSEGIQLVHSHGYKVTAHHLLSRWLGLHRVPVLVTAHGYPKSSGTWKEIVYSLVDVRLLGWAQEVVAVSREMEEYLRRRNARCRVRTIPNGIRPQFTLRRTHPLHRLEADRATDHLPVIGSAGRLVPMKNHALLIQAFAEVRKAHPCRLVILGDGPLRPSLEALWQELLPHEPVNLLPFQADVLEWMFDMDVFCLPSDDGEGLPMALLEAGLLGRPVVCSRSGGMPEVVQDGVNGRLFDIGDARGLVRALADLLSNGEQAAAYGRALRLTVEREYSFSRTHDRYLEAYAHALARS